MKFSLILCNFSLILVLFVQKSLGLYSSGDAVVDLNPSNFNRLVVEGDALWIVEFYAPWCGHCQSLVPEYKKAANALKGVVKVGAVNADEHKSLGGQFGVRGFPTLKVFGADKKKPTDYQGGRTSKDIVEAMLGEARKMVNARMGGRSSGGSGSSGASDKDVIELTDSNFDKKVMQSEDMWLVEFFAPWCGHCKNLAPHWASAASKLKGKAKLGAVDATVHQGLAQRFGVQGYPTIKYFGPGAKEDAEEYDGGRTSGDIVSWLESKLEENVAAPELKQIVSNEIVEEACTKHPLCVIAVLPHILDCQSSCRNDYVAMLTKLGDKYKKKQWGWVWTEAMAQPALEEALDIGGFGYPAMAIVSAKKMKSSLLTGSFGYDGINEFLRDISYGKGRTSTIKGAQMPKIVDVEPWDGKDGTLPEEEDIDLSDVELDDLDKTEL